MIEGYDPIYDQQSVGLQVHGVRISNDSLKLSHGVRWISLSGYISSTVK